MQNDKPQHFQRTYEAVWAGYGPDGNDRRGHMHTLPSGEGPFTRKGDFSGLRGYFCAAPALRDYSGCGWVCSDPPPSFLEALSDAMMARLRAE